MLNKSTFSENIATALGKIGYSIDLVNEETRVVLGVDDTSSAWIVFLFDESGTQIVNQGSAFIARYLAFTTYGTCHHKTRCRDVPATRVTDSNGRDLMSWRNDRLLVLRVCCVVRHSETLQANAGKG